jgi:type IV secretion system protein VirB11
MEMKKTLNLLPFKERLLQSLDSLFQEALSQGRLNKSTGEEEENLVRVCLNQAGFNISPKDVPFLLDWIKTISNLSFLDPILNKEANEIILHSSQLIQLHLQHERQEIKLESLTEDLYQKSLEVFAMKNQQHWNNAHPFVSFLAEIKGQKYRATLTHKSLTPDKCSKLFLRKVSREIFSLDSFQISEGQKEFLLQAVREKKNILICGSTGSGKTSFLKSLIKHISPSEHIITIEDTHELVTQETKTTSLLAQKPQDMKDYCSYALRMSPDRLILGEIRGAETVPFLLAMNTGHRGLLSSLHSNSAVDALSRLALLFQIYTPQEGISYQEVLKLICHGVDFIIYLRSKEVVEIIKVMGSEGTTPYYQLWPN